MRCGRAGCKSKDDVKQVTGSGVTLCRKHRDALLEFIARQALAEETRAQKSKTSNERKRR